MADFPRRAARRIVIGGVAVGGGAPVVVQSMTKTDTRNVRATTAQVRRLERSGCEIVRLAVPDRRAAAALGLIKRRVRVPLVADVHFDHRLALASLDAGADGLRINPGNIGSREKVREVVRAAAGRAVPIRIGVNAGSLEKDLLARHGGATPEAMAESALRHVRILEDCGFGLIKISLKASDVPRTLAAYRLLAGRVDYPFHAGITEAGPLLAGSIKSAAGLALLLAEGLADTIRVSLTAPPEREVYAAWRILESLGIRRRGVELVSCPACGRTEVDLRAVANRVELAVRDIRTPMTVAVMGCTVNGPGEAKEADIGLACGRGNGVIFLKGRVLRKVRGVDMIDDFVEEIGKLARTSAGAGKEEG
jgi:(E)-4-hydroxy-3-methylbut-2-enyl-diphosphate synthase